VSTSEDALENFAC